MKQRTLIKFNHGLGDSVQLTCVFRHLKKYRPDWDLYLRAKRGKHTAGRGHCVRVWHDQEEAPPRDFHQTFDLPWWENYNGYGDCPNSKVTNCLREVFKIDPDPGLMKYQLFWDEEDLRVTREYLESIGCAAKPDGRYNAVLIHYEGNTSPWKKNLDHATARFLCGRVADRGYVPVILDWDKRSPLPDQKTIFNPGVGVGDVWGGFGSGDSCRIAALVQQSSLFVGIDSGPQKCAGATTTPSVGVWTGHHPVQFYDLCDNVLHLVPENWREVPPCQNKGVGDYFEAHYRFKPYAHLHTELAATAASALTGEDPAGLRSRIMGEILRATGYDGADYYEEHKAAGLDYLDYGGWQRDYARWLCDAMGWKGRKVLDVGCACGSILRGLGEAGVVVQGIDVCAHMIDLGRRKWPDMDPLLHHCDAADIKVYGDGVWGGVHCAQTAEHWLPEKVPVILRELNRVCKPGATFFCCLDTQELYDRQNRDPSAEDPTHYCVKPMSWWYDQLASAGWEVCSGEYADYLTGIPGSYLTRYDWDWFVARKA